MLFIETYFFGKFVFLYFDVHLILTLIYVHLIMLAKIGDTLFCAYFYRDWRKGTYSPYSLGILNYYRNQIDAYLIQKV